MNVKLVVMVSRATLQKAKKMPVGTVSKGYKKVAEGKWVPVKKGGAKVAAKVTVRKTQDSITASSKDKEALIKKVMAETDDPRGTVVSGIKKKGDTYTWTESEDIVPSEGENKGGKVGNKAKLVAEMFDLFDEMGLAGSELRQAQADAGKLSAAELKTQIKDLFRRFCFRG